MLHGDSPESKLTECLDGTIMAFMPVLLERVRSNGWSPVQQERFILALEAMGSVGRAAAAVGLSRKSAYALRERAGAESFARAWDAAIGLGRSRRFEVAMEKAMNGTTTVTVKPGGAISVSHREDTASMIAVLGARHPGEARVGTLK